VASYTKGEEVDMTLDSLFETAMRVVPGIRQTDFVVLAAAWTRIYVDGESPSRVIRWARQILGLEPEPAVDELQQLREHGASVRAIAERTGLSRTTVARRLSHVA